MAKAKGGWGVADTVEAIPKKTRQGRGQHTKYSATSRNKAKKRYIGQGKLNLTFFTLSLHCFSCHSFVLRLHSIVIKGMRDCKKNYAD